MKIVLNTKKPPSGLFEEQRVGCFFDFSVTDPPWRSIAGDDVPVVLIFKNKKLKKLISVLLVSSLFQQNY